MPLGFYRVNSLARYVAPAGPAQRTSYTVTAYGDAQVDTAYSQFGGASLYNDGTGDYIEIENDFLFGTTDDFTLEFWYKKHTTNSTEQLASNRGAYDTGHWYIQFDHTTDKIQWGVNGATAQRSSSTFDDTDWHHFALVRDGGDFELFVDGASEGTLAGTYTWGRSGENYKFGAIGGGAGNVSIDEIRISDTPRYTTGFTPSTTPFVNDANTLALVHCDGTDGSTNFVDDNGDRAPLGVTALNDAQVDTGQYKIGSASLQTDGTGDRLEIYQENSELAFGTGDFTIEFWLRMPSLPGSGDYDFIYDARSTGAGTQPSLGVTNSDVFFYTTGAFRITSSTALSTNTWQHIALVRSSGTTTLYQDGSSVGTYSDSNTYTSRDNVKLMLNFNDVNGVNGHLDEFRVSDTARYTGSFTPSTSAFENDSNTLVLLHFEGADTSTDFVDDNGAA